MMARLKNVLFLMQDGFYIGNFVLSSFPSKNSVIRRHDGIHMKTFYSHRLLGIVKISSLKNILELKFFTKLHLTYKNSNYE